MCHPCCVQSIIQYIMCLYLHIYAVKNKTICQMVSLCNMQHNVIYNYICGNKRPTRCNRLVFIAELIVCSTCFRHHYAHHQELKIYTDGCFLWYLALWLTGCWSGVELWVMCPVCGMFLYWLCLVDKTEPVEKHPANRTHNPQLHTRPTTCKPKRQVP